jgi:hypothetical protein
MSGNFRLSAEDRDLLADYCSRRGADAESFQAANATRLAAAYTRANEMRADPSEWLGKRKITSICVVRCSPRGTNPGPPLSKAHRDLLDRYSSMRGSEAISFYERNKDGLIAAAISAAQADGGDASPAPFPPMPPPPPSPAGTPEHPLIGQFQLRFSMIRESAGDVLAVDLDFGTGAPIRAATIDPASIVRGWSQSFAFNLRQPALKATRNPDGSLRVIPPTKPAAAATPVSKLSRFFSRKTK